MDWPAYSPDLNPMEHVWDGLGRRIAARLHHPENTQHRKQMLIEEWALLPQEMLHQLVLSLSIFEKKNHDFRVVRYFDKKRFPFWECTKYGKHELRRRDLRGVLEKVSELLDCPSVSLEELVAVHNDHVCTSSITADKDILKFAQISKNIIDADPDDENEMNISAPAPTSSDMRNIMKSMCSYLDVHPNGEVNNKMDDIEQCVDNLMLKKSIQGKISDCFPEAQ
ncbi:transposable element Tcb2 transposase [Trichonephila clavipes]|uniref:Transposable element Tcb2 transposase n=1 Tax=Trichonephila clavipes TaxID=2585209 RepID=A0A8X6RZ74_TRICX|nr:transposable element Tcb2 transposase [Trichonephila clavipes]